LKFLLPKDWDFRDKWIEPYSKHLLSLQHIYNIRGYI